MTEPSVALPSPVRTVAVIGAGAMGSAVARRLVDHGILVPTLLGGRSVATQERALAAGMIAAEPETIAAADIILTIVPPAEAEAVAIALAGALVRSANKPPFVDCNALSPDSKRRIAACIAPTGCSFVDACIIGSPPGPAHQPRFYMCGEDAGAARVLLSPALDVAVMNQPIGAAATLKMCFAGINKGVTGLTTALLLAAVRAGAGEGLRDEMARSLPQILARSRTSVPALYPKAYRWVAEMREIAAFLADDPAAGRLFEAMADFFADRAADDGAERAMLDTFLRQS